MKKRGKRRKRKRKKKKKSDVGVVDRISALPDEILHNIFSFIDMTTIVTTSILSKRWRHLWTSTPYLSFNSRQLYFQSKNADGYDYMRFKQFVDNVFLRRENSSIIYKFEVYLVGPLFSSCFLNTWLVKSLESHVQIFDLEVHQYDHDEAARLELPDCLFTSEVKTLTLDGLFVIPNTMGSAANITSLHLLAVILPDGNRNGELILSLPVLDNLKMHWCRYNHLNCLTIKCSLLKRFEMISASSEPFGSGILKIHCPNLTWINLTLCLGFIFKVCCLENLSALSNAHIAVSKEDEIHAQHLMEIIKGISNVNALTLSPPLVKCSYHSTEEVQHWEEDEFKICRLKTVEIQNFCGIEEEFKVVELILKTAICLKEVMIVTKEFTEEQLPEIEQKLSALPHASSSVSIRTLRNLHL
ncbi:hypothetical protein AQUCO_11000050v1 [Aquilegia coerulea]|uniref:F-box domain-containing protein n=1 Tax=Aquilegia coerulea TaxID=218851 RepID=A0A2G5C312_AQUCA|nr:hypothetical protein AQUCO_11000050v1 [Aquilegia coerulea]